MADPEAYRDCKVEWRHHGESFSARVSLPTGEIFLIAEHFGHMPIPPWDGFKAWVRQAIDARLGKPTA
jgi:hypothetical protein